MQFDDARAGVAGTADPAAVVDLNFGAAGHLYATHPLHAFAARCPPPLVDWAIRRFSAPRGLVLDPMVGSGTTLVEAALQGRRAWGADIDPLARLIAKVKATPIELGELDQAVNQVEDLLLQPWLSSGWRPDLPDLDRWFLPTVVSDLSRLRAVIMRVECHQDIKDLLWVAFSALIVARTSVANARDLVHSRHHYRRWERDPATALRFLWNLRRFRRLHADYLGRLQAAGWRHPEIRLVGEDARALSIPDGSADLVFTSPPYCSALDYTRAHIFAVGWMPEVLGVSVKDYRLLGRRYLGTERAPFLEAPDPSRPPPPLGLDAVDAVVGEFAGHPGRAWILHRYFREMRAVLRECARVLRAGGRMVLVICPSNIRKVEVPTHRLLADLASSDAGFVLEQVVERTINERRRVMPYLEAAFGPRMRKEYVVVLHRPGRAVDDRRERR